jgi:FtsH-binding integral membrane protein
MTDIAEIASKPATEAKARAGRKSDVERLERELQKRRLEQEIERESTRARRFHADTRMTLAILLGLTGLLCAASFAVSFAGLYAAAEWAVGPNPVLQAAVPLMLDIAIVAFTLALFVERDRGESVRGTWAAIALFAAASSAANVLHTLDVGTAATPAQAVAGAVISGGAPLLLAFASDKAAVRVFRNPAEPSAVTE